MPTESTVLGDQLASFSDIQIQGPGHWISARELLSRANREIKARYPKYPIEELRPVLFIHTGETNRVATIRYDIALSTSTNRVKPLPIAAEVSFDLRIRIKETRLENDVRFQAQPDVR